MRRTTPSKPVRLSSTHNYLFLSDLHIGPGINPHTGKQHSLERFEAAGDYAFAQLLAYHVALSSENSGPIPPPPIFQKPWKLYLNGDTFDFEGISTLPTETEFEKYGRFEAHFDRSNGLLRSTEAVALWKIDTIAAGHPLFFQALGWFIAHNLNEIYFLKGDDDIEIVWPAVQQRIVYHCTAQYEVWLQQNAAGLQNESPLLFSPTLPHTLSRERRSQIHFLAWFDHQKTLFYVEHGNQYDPLSAFGDILNPVAAPTAPIEIEQSAGRQIERNIEISPVDRAPKHLRTPFQTRFLAKQLYFDHLWGSIKACFDTPQKSIATARHLRLRTYPQNRSIPLGPESAPFLPLPANLISKIEEISSQYRKKQQAENQSFGRLLLSAVLFKIGMFGSLLFGFQSFAQDRIFLTIIYLFFAAICYIIQGKFDKWMTQKIDSSHLKQVATEICQILNENREGKEMAVQFHIFGHDHSAAMEEIAQFKNGRQFRQWYINLGSWQQRQSGEHWSQSQSTLPFLRLVPDEIGFETNTPELLVWSIADGRPHQLKIKQVVSNETG